MALNLYSGRKNFTNNNRRSQSDNAVSGSPTKDSVVNHCSILVFFLNFFCVFQFSGDQSNGNNYRNKNNCIPVICLLAPLMTHPLAQIETTKNFRSMHTTSNIFVGRWVTRMLTPDCNTSLVFVWCSIDHRRLHSNKRSATTIIIDTDAIQAKRPTCTCQAMTLIHQHKM